MAKKRFLQANLSAEYYCGYLDEIGSVTKRKYDALFVNICWYYCMNDFSFARALIDVLAPTGVIFVRETTEVFDTSPSKKRKLAYWLNRHFRWKVGHVMPPRGRIEAAFLRLGTHEVSADYRDPITDIVTVRARERNETPLAVGS